MLLGVSVVAIAASASACESTAIGGHRRWKNLSSHHHDPLIRRHPMEFARAVQIAVHPSPLVRIRHDCIVEMAP